MRRRRKIRFDPEYGVVTCYYLPNGKQRCIVLGMDSLTLCEGNPNRDVSPGEIIPKSDIYIYVNTCGRVKREDLIGHEEILEKLILEHIKRNVEDYLNFLNYSGMYSKTVHYLELLPGIGRAARKKIEENRPYSSLEEVKAKTRVDFISALTKRILRELLGETNEKIFVY